MATAKKENVVIQPPAVLPPAICATRIRLDLSINEAETLALILTKCGGNPNLSRRGQTDKIHKALESIGFSWMTIGGPADWPEPYRRLEDVFQKGSYLNFNPQTLDPSKD